MQSPVCQVDKIETALRGVLGDATKAALKAAKGAPRGDKAQKCPDRLLTKYLGFMGKAPHRARVKARPRVFVALLAPSKRAGSNIKPTIPRPYQAEQWPAVRVSRALAASSKIFSEVKN